MSTSPMIVNFLKAIGNEYIVSGYSPEDVIDIRNTSNLSKVMSLKSKLGELKSCCYVQKKVYFSCNRGILVTDRTFQELKRINTSKECNSLVSFNDNFVIASEGKKEVKIYDT